jgi:hypothetical protein
MIKFKPQGRLGNILLQNVGASILAKKFNYKVNEYYNTYEMDRLGVKLYEGSIINENYRQYGDSSLISLLASQGEIDHGICYDGFFQVLEFLTDYRDEIKSSIQRDNWNKRNISDVFIHVRLGDSINYNPGLQYYERCLDLIPSKQDIYISSDSPDHPIVTALCTEHQCILVDTGPVDTMNFARTFNNMILSNGTFSWWLAMLGSPDNIFYPKKSCDVLAGFHPDIYYSDWRGIE